MTRRLRRNGERRVSSDRRSRPRTGRWAWRATLLAPAFLTLFPHRWHPLEILALLAPQIALCLLLLSVIVILVRRRVGAELLVAGALLLGVAAFFAEANRATRDMPGDRLRVVLYNAQGNESPGGAAFDDWLIAQDPDLVCLIDPPSAYLKLSSQIAARYPHRVEPEPGKWWGIILLSRHPLAPSPLAPLSNEVRHSFIVRRSVLVNLPSGSRFLFTGSHPPSPRTSETLRDALAQAQLDGLQLQSFRERTALPIVVVGDFNSTPTGAAHRMFRRSSGLQAWAPLFGAGTWPSWAPPSIGVAIDRVWTSQDVGIQRFEVGPRFRSDHRPVLIELTIPFSESPEPQPAKQGTGEPGSFLSIEDDEP